MQSNSRVLVLALSLGLASFLATPTIALSAETDSNLFLLLEAESLAGYSEIVDQDGTFSTLNKWLVSPNLQLNDNTVWINAYNGNFNRSKQVVTQEEGGRESTTQQSHSITTAIKHNVTKTWSLRPLFFADWVFVKETNDEDFGDGLYDYRDIGGGIESAWTLVDTKEQENTLRLGFRLFDREYPNYQSLLSLFDPNGTREIDEKDFLGYKTSLSYDAISAKEWSWGLEGILVYKDFSDKQTINSNGIRTGDNREDFLNYVNAYLSRPISKEFIFRLDGQFALNLSNLDFYDTRNTLGLGDDSFISDYFDYYSFLVRPTLAYVKEVEKGKKFSLSLSYAFSILQYTGRLAQNRAGAYLSDEQEDTSHTFSSRVSVPITKQLSWITVGTYSINESNQEFETFYLYDYDIWSAVTGISFKY